MSLAAGKEPPCRGCPQSPARLSKKSLDALAVFQRLAVRREWDGMTGMPRAIPLSEIRAECGRTDDPDAVAERVQILDEAFMKATLERLADRQKREKAKLARKPQASRRR